MGNTINTNVPMIRAPNSCVEKSVSEGVYVHHMAMFLTPNGSTSYPPKVGDHIIAADGTWTILGVTESYRNSPLIIHADRLEIVVELSDRITIYRVTLTADDYGGYTSVRAVLQSNISCRIQHLEDIVVNTAGTRGMKKEHIIYFANEYEASYADLIVDDYTGTEYFVEKSSGRDRIDELTAVNCFITPIGQATPALVASEH